MIDQEDFLQEIEPEIDDGGKFCPDCERQNQFGDQCESCCRDEQEGFRQREHDYHPPISSYEHKNPNFDDFQ